MFSVYHFIWLAICIILIAVSVVWLKKNHPSLTSVLTVCCIIAAVSEFIKVFSVIELVPSADGSTYYPYLELQHLPFHVCSIQVFLIFYARFAKEGKMKETILAFMYPMSLGGVLALLMPSIFTTTISVSQAFTHPIAYQFFLYHAMLIVLGIYIPMSKEVNIRSRHFFSSIGILGAMVFIALYLNSMFAEPVYENGVLQSVEYTTNFIFTYKAPISIEFTELWQWYVYIAVLVSAGAFLIWLTYLPYYIKEKREKRRISN